MLALLIPCEGDSTVGAVGLSKTKVHFPHMPPAVRQPVGGKRPATEGTGKTRRGFQHTCIGAEIHVKIKVCVRCFKKMFYNRIMESIFFLTTTINI